MGLVGNRFETDDTDKAGFPNELDDPLPETVFDPMEPLPGHPALGRQPAGRQRQQIFHDVGIGGHSGERRNVLVSPGSQ